MIGLQQVAALVLLLLISLSNPVSATGASSSTFYPRSVSTTAGTKANLTPDREPVALHDERSWRLSLDGQQPYDIISVSLRLPREGLDLQVEAKPEDGYWLFPSIRFDTVGVWLLTVDFKTATGPDRVQFKLAIDDTPFTVSTNPTAQQINLLNAMALDRNAESTLTDTELKAARLGHEIFFDNRLSRDGQTSCASCHSPTHAFSDGKTRSHADTRNAPGLIGIANNRWFNRDGSKDSLWSQALGPLENSNEHDLDRVSLLRIFSGIPDYVSRYNAIFERELSESDFADLPAASPRRGETENQNWESLPALKKKIINRHFANIGKLLAAYEAQLSPRLTAFDRYTHALSDGDPEADRFLEPDAKRGLMLFISSRTHCLNCHVGPTFSNQQFHNIGTTRQHQPNADRGRERGIPQLLSDPFNCSNPYNTDDARCAHLDDPWRTEIPYLLRGAFVTPGLREVARTGPWFHDGSAATLMDVMQHYRQPPASRSGRTEHELSPINLTDSEMQDVVAFLESLSSEPDDTSPWYRAPQ